MDQLERFGQVYAIDMLQHILTSYRAIDKTDLDENEVKTMEPYDSTEPLARLIEKLEKGREFVRVGGKTITEMIMVSKGINLLSQTAIFNKDIREWRQKPPTSRDGPYSRNYYIDTIVNKGER